MFGTRLRRALWVTAGAGVAIRLLLPWLSQGFLLEYIVSDDAFYYLTIARNMVGGLGVTFDGVTPTNGFHPLWLLCLLPVYALVHDAGLALRLSLMLGALFGAGAVLLLGIAVRRWTHNPIAGGLAAALFAFNPTAIVEGVNGLETSLALLMLSIVLVLLASWHPLALRGSPFAIRHPLWLGLASGLLIWARSDMALVLAGLYAYLLFSRQARFWSLVAAGGVAAVLVALWLAWGWAVVGSPMQSSAVAIPWLFRARMDDAIAAGLMAPAQVMALVWRHFVQTTLYQMVNYSGIGLLAGLIALLVSIVRRDFSSTSFALPGWLGWGAAGTLVMLALSEFVRFSLREWYIAPLSLWAAVLGSGLLAAWADVPQMRRWLVAACVASGLVAGGQAWRDLSHRGRYWFQADQLAAARWIAAHTPQDAVVGSWTAGIYGYFAERRVVNLDGVVNWDAIRAYQARRLYAYIRERRIGWIVDFDEFVADFTNFYGADPAAFLKPVRTFEDARAPFGRLVVYEVQP